MPNLAELTSTVAINRGYLNRLQQDNETAYVEIDEITTPTPSELAQLEAIKRVRKDVRSLMASLDNLWGLLDHD